jgi:hypothetical protein
VAPTSLRGGQLATRPNDDSQPKFGAVARASSAARPEAAGQVAGRPGPPLADPLAYKARPITMGPLKAGHHGDTHKCMNTPHSQPATAAWANPTTDFSVRTISHEKVRRKSHTYNQPY